MKIHKTNNLLLLKTLLPSILATPISVGIYGSTYDNLISANNNLPTHNLQVILGQSIDLPCQGNNDNELITWSINYGSKDIPIGLIGHAPESFGKLSDQKLLHMIEDQDNNQYNVRIKEATFGHDAIYTCQKMSALEPYSIVKVEVLKPPTDLDISISRTDNLKSPQKPTNNLNNNKSNTIYAISSTENQFQCIVKNTKPAAEITWFRDGEEINDGSVDYRTELMDGQQNSLYFWGL